MNDPLAWIDAESAEWAERGLARRLVPNGPVASGRLERDGEVLVNFGSNDYLGLACDPRVVAAARKTAETFGWGAGAASLVTGWSTAHRDLVDDLARFEHAEAVALFSSGFAANLGAISALVGRGDAVYLDRLDHASLVDGARLAGASLRVYPHNDVGRLASILRRDRSRYRRSMIATDGVFGMDGDLAPVAELCDLADEFGAILLVDEAHGTGVCGPDGRGASAACGVADRVHVRVGTLSKALGSVGGFVAGSRRLIDWIVNHGRTFVYSTAIPPAAAAAAREALAIARAEPERRSRVYALGEVLRAGLKAGGFDVGSSTGPIVPVLLGPPEQALAFSERLRRSGVLVPAIRPPTVPAGTSRLRISLTASHTEEDVRALVDALLA